MFDWLIRWFAERSERRLKKKRLREQTEKDKAWDRAYRDIVQNLLVDCRAPFGAIIIDEVRSEMEHRVRLGVREPISRDDWIEGCDWFIVNNKSAMHPYKRATRSQIEQLVDSILKEKSK